MGEYAYYKDQSIKIGTGTGMYYLRWDQRHLVEPQYGNVNPVTEAPNLWYRLPRLAEIGIEPGSFPYDGPYGAVPIPIYVKNGTPLRADIDSWLKDETHLGTVTLFNEAAGIAYNVKCNHGKLLKNPPEAMMYNGFQTNTLEIVAVSVRSVLDLTWQAVAKIRCRVCGKELFGLTRRELQEFCGVLGNNPADEQDFNYLLRYMKYMEQEIKNSASGKRRY